MPKAVNVIENVYAKISDDLMADCDKVTPLNKPTMAAKGPSNPYVTPELGNSAALKTANWGNPNEEETQEFVFFDMEDST